MGTGGDLETELDGRGRRLLACLENGDIDAVDAEIDASTMAADALGRPPGSWRVFLWQGMRALLEGRFDESRRANEAAAAGARLIASSAGETACATQAFLLLVARGRRAEAEASIRALAGEPHASPAVRASLAWLLGLLGRDGEARAELIRLSADRFASQEGRVASIALLAELSAVLYQRVEAAVLYDLLLPHQHRFAVEGEGAACHGSVSRHLGLLAHCLGRWDDASAHFEVALADNRRIGAPLLVADTCRQLSALLRVRGGGGDWERAVDLLAEAEAIYRRLGVDGPADEARTVLARSVDAAWESPDGPTGGAAGANVFRREGEAWVVGYGGRMVRLPGPAPGLADLACLVANPGLSFHVADLAARADADGADAGVEEEYRARLAQLDDDLAAALAADDRVRAALARAERDMLAAELADRRDGGEGPPDGVDEVRRAVTTRMRLALDRIDALHPSLARHLRLSLRTGTFCSYEPAARIPWNV